MLAVTAAANKAARVGVQFVGNRLHGSRIGSGGNRFSPFSFWLTSLSSATIESLDGLFGVHFGFDIG